MVVRDELLKFHSHFYSSNIMGLAVLGQQVQPLTIFYSKDRLFDFLIYLSFILKKIDRFIEIR